MSTIPDLTQEAARIADLRRYGVLDSGPEKKFDEIVALAAEICDVPVSLVSLVDADRQYFKARIGLEETETARDISFCQHTILGQGPMIVPDATLDPRFVDNPLVTGSLGVRFYAGLPLVTPLGHALGTLCVIDRRPRTLDSQQLRMLDMLARQAMTQLELRRALAESEQALAESESHKARYREAVDRQKEIVWEMAHRMKNTLAIVQSIVTQTFRQVSSLEEGRDAVEARLSALARAQNVLTQAHAGEVEIGEVVRSALAPHFGSDGKDRFSIDGPSVQLGSRQALGLSLGLHELATNAAKYGSLSHPNGAVSLEWSLDGEAFSFAWTERGGPPVSTPTRSGFGSRLVERIVAAYFEGQGKLDFAPQGLQFRLNGRATTPMAEPAEI